MAKLDKKINGYRMSGAAWMMNYILENGIEEGKKELGRRQATFIPLEVSPEQMDKFCQDVKNEMLDAVLVLGSSILVDKFEFTDEQMDEFVNAFNNRADCIGDDYVSWHDILNQLKDDTGLDLKMRFLEVNNGKAVD